MKFKQKGSAITELIVSIISLAILLFFLLIWKWAACSNYGNLTERITRFNPVSGCFVKTNTGWIPQEEMSKRAYGNSIVTENSDDK